MKRLFFITLLVMNSAEARSLKATADKLASETTRIGLGLALFGIGLAAIYFMIGKQDAGMKLNHALFGSFVLLLSPAILSFIKGLV
ncbi:MAG: hypothetical protein COW00_07860 [Bdellovibrio sp. CG12_big_fil_rev_8_21_14_0_65_39_13]|nr:MAG: hypothetical protein COW78_12115 [Bdellovibrio sp. CG22_combo_CG10-13_8_21_14_all_39_27]PIQ60060.1 MAG: hypothetical protein COW00_07860 [Bdellovibrio sp. CG12_big_fil_rev_8_21_14_0_65_39_13]PIR36905.1 MAG: hypothetical protein COV37_01010 [Bdellovibrio sp. CG11_big_fil_rev_8_21_14_0_20_39_38]